MRVARARVRICASIADEDVPAYVFVLCMHALWRDIDLYHWSSARFSATWIDTISVLLAKGRARVGVADAATDWPRRIRDMQYLDHESLEAGA